jgi:hypothetical protein
MAMNLKRPAFVWALLLCIVAVNGFMAAPSVGHVEHHGDHQAGTHSTGICAWLCAAGDGIEPYVVQFASSFQLVERAISASSIVVHSADPFSYFLRGPPISFS